MKHRRRQPQPKEFFDRDYPMRQAYLRALRYAKPYRWRIAAGLVCGLLTAGTLVPLFQMVRPAVGALADRPPAAERQEADAPSGGGKLPGWYREAEKLAARAGIAMTDEKGALGGEMLVLALIIVPAVAALRLLLRFLNGYCLSWAATHALSDLSCDMLRHVQRQSLEFHSRTDVGRLMSRIVNDPAEIRTIIRVMMAELAQAPFEIAVAVGYIVCFAVENDMLPTLIAVAVGFPAFMLPVKRLGMRIRRYSREAMQRAAGLLGRVHEVLTCMKLVKSANTGAYENGLYAAANREQVKIALRAARAGLSVAPAVEMVGVLLLCALVGWCFFQRVSLERILPMLAPLLVVYKPVKQLTKLQVQLESGMAALARVFSLLDVHCELPEPAAPRRVERFGRELRMENVSFAYAGAGRKAVDGVSLTLPRGSTVAVVGGTGSGKSTLAALLARFADPDSGRVLLDGVDLREIATGDLRRLIGVVTQDPQLFNDTIAANIAYGSEGADMEAIVRAARLARADGFIRRRPEGYGCKVGEKGLALSGGERQRIAIARAFLRNPPVLVLDEATSALDTVTEAEVQAALDGLMANRTTFVIAHRLATVRRADSILVMDAGRIVERGTHEELLARGGRYAQLHRMQETGA